MKLDVATMDLDKIEDRKKIMDEYLARFDNERPKDCPVTARLVANLTDADTYPEEPLDADACYMNRLANVMEAFPVIANEQTKHPMYFALSRTDAAWIPCYNAEVKRSNGWAICGFTNDDGSKENLAQAMFEWAHVDADGGVSIPVVFEMCRRKLTKNEALADDSIEF